MTTQNKRTLQELENNKKNQTKNKEKILKMIPHWTKDFFFSKISVGLYIYIIRPARVHKEGRDNTSVLWNPNNCQTRSENHALLRFENNFIVNKVIKKSIPNVLIPGA